jgi:hypothetical protein
MTIRFGRGCERRIIADPREKAEADTRHCYNVEYLPYKDLV